LTTHTYPRFLLQSRANAQNAEYVAGNTRYDLSVTRRELREAEEAVEHAEFDLAKARRQHRRSSHLVRALDRAERVAERAREKVASLEADAAQAESRQQGTTRDIVVADAQMVEYVRKRIATLGGHDPVSWAAKLRASAAETGNQRTKHMLLSHAETQDKRALNGEFGHEWAVEQVRAEVGDAWVELALG